MKVQDFVKCLNSDFYAGVPDSQLKALCDYLANEFDAKKHIIAANEGNAVALAAGYHLATGKTPVVYMQNSGEGNIINPVASLMNDNVYGIPCIFVVGWRGEPGVHDEPQHVYQGQVTLKLLEDMNISYFIVSKETSVQEIKAKMKEFKVLLKQGKQVAFVVRKGAFVYDGNVQYKNENKMVREEIIRHIVAVTKDDVIVSTTGKASRELFEIREANGQGHGMDFLTVGSMGHTSSIALGVALNKPNRKVWCIDGDGSVLMHMGSLAVLGSVKPKNLVHIVINNCAHETVGGMPTAARDINLIQIAKACGYENVVCAKNYQQLDKALKQAKASQELTFIEVKSSIGSRKDLGRPTTTAQENKKAFMKTLRKEK